MASINFRTRGKGKENASVYITFSNTINGKRTALEIKSGITIPNSDWLAKGKAKGIAVFTNKLEVQAELDRLRTLVSNDLINTSNYTKEWLQGLINEFHGIKPEVKKITLTDAIDSYVEYITKRASESRQESTAKTYRVTKMRVQKFNKHTKKEVLLSEVNLHFKEDFIYWAKWIEKYRPSTYLKSLKQIKTVVRYAKRMGLEVDENFLNDKESNEVKDKRHTNDKPIYLNLDEINRLMKFEGANYLENARDWLVVSCWTACRISDLMQLTTDNLHITISGEKAIRYKQQKTGDRINAPYHPHVEEINSRHGGGFPRVISHPNYNEFIKELCLRVGMTEIIKGDKRDPKTNRNKVGQYPKYELIASHIGRRSFCTNHYGQMPIEDIMLVSGHDTVRDFLIYIGADPEEHVSRMNEYYRKKSVQGSANLKTAEV